MTPIGLIPISNSKVVVPEKDKIMKNDHMAFEVSDMDQSIRFYSQVLGLRLIFRKVNTEEQEEYAFLELTGGNLELIQRLGGEPFTRPTIGAAVLPASGTHQR